MMSDGPPCPIYRKYYYEKCVAHLLTQHPSRRTNEIAKDS